MDRYAPDGTAFPQALARARRLAVVAHPDDAEVMALGAIGRGLEGEPFALVVCTDGAGAPGPGAGPSGAALADARRAEQRRAAEIGNYAAVVQLGLSSARVRADGWPGLVDRLVGLLAEAGAQVVLTHSPVDRHPTHVAVGAAVVAAARRLDPQARPERLLGCEVWGGLDWLAPEHRVETDAGGRLGLGRRLLGAHRTQNSSKPYDRAAAGRRLANATFARYDALGGSAAIELAMDLTPVLAEHGPSLVQLVRGAYAAAQSEALGRLRAYED